MPPWPDCARSWRAMPPGIERYRLLAGAEADIDRILLESARAFGVDAADRYGLLMRSVFAALAAVPGRPGSQEVATAAGVRVYPLRIGRRLVVQE